MIDDKFDIIFWDFDGVIMDSNEIRNSGFEKVLAKHPKHQVEKLLDFHKKNGGLSRYVKFRYFFEEIRNSSITDAEVIEWAQKFSDIMVSNLLRKDLLIEETNHFIKKNYSERTMHIVSGSDQTELRYICDNLGIADYFKSIHGSPTPKVEHVKNLLVENAYKKSACILIGDSINDYEAAVENGISFKAYNNAELNDHYF